MTPSEIDTFSKMIRSALVGASTALPGQIVAYDHQKRRATVQVAIRREYASGEVQAINPIAGVPVVFPGGAGADITWALAEGDEVLLVFADRALDLWLERGGIVDPYDYRIHDLSDAIAIPGLRSFRNAPQATEDGLLIRQPQGGATVALEAGGAVVVSSPGGGRMEITPAGQVSLGNSAIGVEIVSLLDELVDRLIAAVVAPDETGVLGFDPATTALLVALKAKIQLIKV